MKRDDSDYLITVRLCGRIEMFLVLLYCYKMYNISNLILVMLHCSNAKYVMHTVIDAGRHGFFLALLRLQRDTDPTSAHEWKIASLPLIVCLHGPEIER